MKNEDLIPDGILALPYTENERRLLQIWTEVLNSKNVGIHEDFFSLGGDSLAAMRCINRISTVFGVELPIDLFLLHSAPIVQVASVIAEMRRNADGSATADNC